MKTKMMKSVISMALALALVVGSGIGLAKSGSRWDVWASPKCDLDFIYEMI